MSCISDARRFSGALNTVCFLELLAPPLLLARFHYSSEIVSSEQFPPHPAVYKANWACQDQNHHKAAKRIKELQLQGS